MICTSADALARTSKQEGGSMRELDGKVAIVTGAGRGIGRGIAIAYGRAGARVVVASRTPATVDQVVRTIREEGGEASGLTCDVGQREQVQAMIGHAVETFGTVDILVNNAQSYRAPGSKAAHDGSQPLETYDEADWDAVYLTGVKATLWAMQAAFPHMKSSGGKIINLGSSAAQIGLAGYGAYAAAKEGIRGLSRVAAREWGRHGINVNVINPAVESDGLLQLKKDNPALIEAMTAQIPLGRWGEPIRDSGALAVFLASPASDYITGMTFMLDGGQFMFP
jgi:2-hydroxycyclohexanecarboxyl-CoA dehydrogenase